MSFVNVIEAIVVYLFYGVLTLIAIRYIIESLVFIGPMMKQYKIMATDISNSIKPRYIIFLLLLIFIGLFLLILYHLNKILCLITVLIYIVDIFYLISQYKQLNLLHFLNKFSKDLFDWEKIYNLDIDNDLKRQCFKIHSINYEQYEKQYLQKLKIQQELIEKKIQTGENNGSRIY